MSRVNFALLLLILISTLHRSPAAQSTVKGEKQRTGTVSGQVTLNGEPLGGITVRLFPDRMSASGDPRSPHQAVADEQGRYRITGIIEGTNDPTVLAKLSQLRIGGFSKNQQPVILPREPARINSDGSFRVVGLRPGRIYFSLVRDPKVGGFSIKRIERDGALAQDGIEIGPGENLSKVRVIVGHGNLTLRGEVKVIGGSLPPHIGIYVNLNRVNESESGGTLGAFVDGRGQFMFQNLIPGDYEVRLIGNNFQPGEPRDKSLSKLIYNTRQKVSIGNNSQPTVTLVIDLGQKESNQ